MSSVIAVLDACVLFPAPLRDTLLRAANASLFRPIWSDEILQEMRRNLVKQNRMTDKQFGWLVDHMNAHFMNACVAVASEDVDRMTNHPKDRHVIAAAVNSDAGVIVTFNLKHFPREALDVHGIKLQSPDDFLQRLLEMDSEQMLIILRKQVSDLHQPEVTLDEVLKRLAKQVPEFVAAVRQAL